MKNMLFSVRGGVVLVCHVLLLTDFYLFCYNVHVLCPYDNNERVELS